MLTHYRYRILPEGIIEAETVNDILVSNKTELFLAGLGVPHLTGPIITAGNEPKIPGKTYLRPY